MNQIPTSEFLKKFSSRTTIVISLKENGSYETVDVLLKDGDTYWTSVYTGKSIKNSNIPKYLEYLIDGVEEYTIKVDPNKHSPSDDKEPIHIFSGEQHYTTNNTFFLKGHSHKTPAKKSAKKFPKLNVESMF